MGSDRARRSYDPSRRYRSVVPQQGRVTLEADANEAEEIRADASRAELVDVVGPTGSPDDGFEISVPPAVGRGKRPSFPHPHERDLAIAAGTLYVGGMRIQCTSSQATYQAQRKTEWVDYPAGIARHRAPIVGGNELVYLALWEQEVSAVEDPALLEVALGGPDTAARTRLVQRVQRHGIHGTHCKAGVKELLKDVYPPSHFAYDRRTCQLTSALRLRVDYAPEDAEQSACQPIAQAGFLGPDNQLIRVQVSEDEKLLWAFDDASTLFRATLPPGGLTIQLQGTPVDEAHQPQAGQFVEVLATAVDLGGDARMASAVGVVRGVLDYDPTARIVKLQAALPEALVKSPPLQVYVRLWENQHDVPGVPANAKVDASVELFQADGNSTGVRVSVNEADRVPGDYWLIGVRPAKPDDVLPARLADFQPPDGPRRWGVPLAVVRWGDEGKAKVTDCRRRFQSLVDNDLAFHNRHLHGWGVVCGLQVTCLPDCAPGSHPGECVQVADGYAIDPTGVDIRLRSDGDEGRTPVAIGELAERDGALPRGPDGKISDGAISLWIDPDCELHAERYDPDRRPSPLEGTLYQRIVEDCILKVLRHLKEELTPGERRIPVDVQRKRLTALLDLYLPAAMQKPELPLYLSGEKDPAAAGTEDAILRALFLDVKALLQSHTFCAMFDDVAYPAYGAYRSDLPAEARHPTTIFGPGPKFPIEPGELRGLRLRASPSGRWGLVFGLDATIEVYDLPARALVAIAHLPSDAALRANPIVRDVAFEPGDDGRVHVIAAMGSDSVYQVGSLGQDGKIQWNGARQGCPQLSLDRAVVHGQGVFATADGKGLYRLHSGAPPERVGDAFDAGGPLLAGGAKLLYAGVKPKDGTPGGVLVLDPSSASSLEKPRYLGLPNDGSTVAAMALVPPSGGKDAELHAVIFGGESTAARLLVWKAMSGSEFPGAKPIRSVELQGAVPVDLAYSKVGEWMLMPCPAECAGRVYRPDQTKLEDTLHPLQFAPLAAVAAGDFFYVLNAGSRTLTAIPASDGTKTPWVSAIDPLSMATYRRDALAAFVKLLGRYLQFLKDCACEHMMIQCPGTDGKVYLADVTFKGGKVYQICNARRKYVHTFPTVEHWLSLVPVIPLLERFMEDFCGKVLVDGFTADGNYSHGDLAHGVFQQGKQTHVAFAVNAATWIGALLPALGQRRDLVQAAIRYLRTRLAEALSKPKARVPIAIDVPDRIIDRPAEEAKTIASSAGVSVRRVVVASGGAGELGALLRSPVTAPGEEVDLVTDARGRVLGWRKAAAEAAPAGPAPAPAADELAGLRSQLSTMLEEHQRQAATVKAMEKQVADLSAALAALRK